LGLFLSYIKVHKIPYHYFKSISGYYLPVVWILLAYTLMKGTVIDGSKCQPMDTNSFYWYYVSNINVSIYCFIYLCSADIYPKNAKHQITFQVIALLNLWLPVFELRLMLILPANFSTAALIFSMVIMMVFIGKYPLKYIGIILGARNCQV
jgi:cell division protein FtsW